MKRPPKKAKWRCVVGGCRAHKADGAEMCRMHLREVKGGNRQP